MSDTIGHFIGRCDLGWAQRYTKDGAFNDIPHPWFDFLNDPINPLTYVLPDRWIRPAQSFSTDFGSVPSELQSLVGPLDVPNSYLFHDSAFGNHGWWESTDAGKTWVYIAKTMEEVNDMLFDMAEAEGMPWSEREEMFEAVQIGGGPLWNHHAGPFPQDPAPQGDVS